MSGNVLTNIIQRKFLGVGCNNNDVTVHNVIHLDKKFSHIKSTRTNTNLFLARSTGLQLILATPTYCTMLGLTQFHLYGKSKRSKPSFKLSITNNTLSSNSYASTSLNTPTNAWNGGVQI